MSAPPQIFLAITAFVLAACTDLDLLDKNRCDIGFGYYLEFFPDNGNYYVQKSGSHKIGGTFDGIIRRIGWNNTHALAERKSVFGEDPNGLFSIELATGKISGPLNESAINSDPNLKSIALEKPQVYFK